MSRRSPRAQDTDAPRAEFNATAGLFLKEVSYSTLSLRGLGSGGPKGNFISPQPTRPVELAWAGCVRKVPQSLVWKKSGAP